MDVKNYTDECDKIASNIRDIYKEIIEYIYYIIPNSWHNNRFNVYNTRINSFISNGFTELKELVQAFPENHDKEMLDYKKYDNEIQIEQYVDDLKQKSNSINVQIHKYVENEEKNANEYSYIVKEKGEQAKKSIEYMINSIEECLKEYYTKKTKLESRYNKSIAIIMPAYNTKKTIRRALNSIACQNVNDILQLKTYIVNDCSMYNYQDIITEYSPILNIEEIELKENVGPGLARQNGILKCKEDFIIFLDGDDFFYNEKTLETLLTAAIDNDADCVTSYFREEFSNGQYRDSNNMGWLHGKFYKASFIKEKKIEFINSRATEDAAFNMLLQVNNPKIVSIQDITYVWANNEDSITRRNNYEFSHTYIESYSENIRRILELTAEKNLNMQIAMQQTLNSLFVIWTNYITFKDKKQRENTLKWTNGLKNAFDKWKSEYLSNDRIYEIFKVRKNLYNPKWTPSFARDCFENFLKRIDNYNNPIKEVKNEKRKMNILVSFDEDYTSHAIDMLNSITLNNDVTLDIYLMYNNLSYVSINAIRDYVEANNVGILHEYYMNGSQYKFPQTIQYIPEVTYYRLFAPFIIKEDVDKLLYLDCDLIVNGKLDDLYNIDMGNDIIVGCKNMLCKEMSHLNAVFNTNLGLPDTNDYINAGVLLINVLEYKKHVNPNQIIQFINENRANLKMQDQDVINKLFYGKIKHIDNRFNYQINAVDDNFQDNDLRIIHYSQKSKPWHNDYSSPQKAKYYYNFLAQKGDICFLREIVNLHTDCLKNKLIRNAMNNYNGE